MSPLAETLTQLSLDRFNVGHTAFAALASGLTALEALSLESCTGVHAADLALLGMNAKRALRVQLCETGTLPGEDLTPISDALAAYRTGMRITRPPVYSAF